MPGESCYGSFEVLIGRDKVGLDEIKAEVVDWIQENWSSVSKENISAVRCHSCNLGKKSVFKIGDRVGRKANGKPWYGTVVAISSYPPDAVVRFDNGALRHITPHEVIVLERRVCVIVTLRHCDVMEIAYWPKGLNSVSNTSTSGSLERNGSMKKKLSITLSEELVEEIDERRGLIPRSTFLEDRLRREFGLETEE